MVKLLKGAAFALLLCLAPQARAAEIEDAAWLTGRWIGEGLGGALEEAWSAPAGGQMVGYFRLTRDGAPVFYEFLLLDIVDGGLRLRVKHFNPDFTGWEERDAWISFNPVSVSAEELAFSGLVITREGEDRMAMRLRMRRGGESQQEVLTFRRAGP